MNRQLQDLQAEWDALGADDPLHAILNDPKTRAKPWRLAEFFQAGEREIGELLRWLEARGTLPQYWEKALDFGCGVGRLTRPLARQFHEVVGVDIAPSMLDTAQRCGPPKNCRFVLNESESLACFGDASFDFIYSSIVLQHMPAPLSLGYLHEFCRLLRPGGVAVFQIPVERRVPLTSRAAGVLRQLRGKLRFRTRIRCALSIECNAEGPARRGEIRMFCVPENEILAVLEENGMRAPAKAYTNSCDRDYNGNLEIFPEPHFRSHFLSRIFAARK